MRPHAYTTKQDFLQELPGNRYFLLSLGDIIYIMEDFIGPVVAVIGAGPAGLFAARDLAANGVQVVIFNRDIKPGGLAEYGIYPEKHKMKEGLRKQFRQILAMPNIHYLGNALVGLNGDFSIDDLMKMGFDALLVTVGAQATKWLGIPGENLKGVYHAKDVVYHYNRLPPFSQMNIQIGRKVAVVGAGNVMLDLARWLITEKMVSEVLTIVRRGPAEVKFDKAQLEYVAGNVSWSALKSEFDRVAPIMKAVGENTEETFEFFRSACDKVVSNPSASKMSFHFLASPVQIIGDDKGSVKGLEVEENSLTIQNEMIVPVGNNVRKVFDVDTIIFAIGDRVDSRIGLPTSGNEFLKNPAPRFPIEGQSFEVFDSADNKPMEGLFMAGWARKASTGLVGTARKDGTQGAAAVLQYLREKPAENHANVDLIIEKLTTLKQPIITKQDIVKLEEIESERAVQLGLPEFKYASNSEMLKAIGRGE
jgi:ferredoxin/flavodoxin---NADP+ reductase